MAESPEIVALRARALADQLHAEVEDTGMQLADRIGAMRGLVLVGDARNLVLLGVNMGMSATLSAILRRDMVKRPDGTD